MKISSNEDLQKHFRQINEWYFDSKLPDVPVRFGRPYQNCLASTTFSNKGSRVYRAVEIIIKRSRGSRTMLLSLAHEMMHVKFTSGITNKKNIVRCKIPNRNPSEHPWSKEVRRLAKAGLFDWLI